MSLPCCKGITLPRLPDEVQQLEEEEICTGVPMISSCSLLHSTTGTA